MPLPAQMATDLAEATAYSFADWPNPAVPNFGAGVYTIWHNDGRPAAEIARQAADGDVYGEAFHGWPGSQRARHGQDRYRRRSPSQGDLADRPDGAGRPIQVG